MMLNSRLLLVFLWLGAGSIVAQDTLSTNTMAAQEKRQTTIQKDTLRIIDSITTTSVSQDLPLSFLKHTVRDSVFYKMPDDSLAMVLDAAWRKELIRKDLFDTITKMVKKVDYADDVHTELPTDTLKKRLAHLNAKTPFNISYNPTLERLINSYLKRHKPAMEQLMALSKFYFPLFEETFDQYDVPLEMKYLALVESGLRPDARSRVGATGLWQFMFTTGKMYDLEVNSYVDDRMDPIKSSEAAAKYLSKLYELFGDWDLALASYNSGPGNVSKAIRRSGGYTNYWNLRGFLPRETAGYVPAFLAFTYLFEYAEEHGYQSAEPPVQYFATDTIHIKEMIGLDQVTKLTTIPLAELEFLNPQFKLGIIPKVKDKQYYIRVPIESVGTFVYNEEAIYAFAKAEFDKKEKPLPKFFDTNSSLRYRVRSGDYLGKIAARYGVGVSQIKRWNNLRSNSLKIGQRLTIYPRKVPAQPQAAKATANNGEKSYTVQKGDSLWKIAQKFPGVTVENIKVWNGISGNSLKPGMKLLMSK